MSRSSLVRLALLALLWGSSFLWIKLALRGFTPVQIVLVRLVLGVIVLAPIAMMREMKWPTGSRTWGHLFVAALVANAIPYTLFGVGEQTVGSNVAGVLNATTPLWTVLIAFLVGADRAVSPKRAIGMVLGFTGTLLIFSPWRSAGEIASWGGIACLAAAASYGVSYVYMGKFLAGRGISSITLAASQLAAGAILVAFALPVQGFVAPSWRVDAVASLLVLGLLGTGAAYVLNYRLIEDEGPTVASTTTYLLPIVAVVLGALVVNEQLTWSMFAGMIFVLAGIGLAQQRKSSTKAESTTITR
ncbi:DMT family transporter [Micromonospora sp. WMMD882]|uniref:DMT family transporter n=1 Tax=Micromonospora sp. WMMD882 TaxID=3015151 RepID=UPI00248BE91F|nr:DMT family transporter [Micromonospora sp. WMMD882]WBB81281.1 DMT family transporter [Micromonospora sp. WMMD882]